MFSKHNSLDFQQLQIVYSLGRLDDLGGACHYKLLETKIS